MQHTNLERRHSHQFDQGNPLAQKRILIATILTAIMMVFEILGGWLFNSMALLADGWHMSSHMLALGLAYFAYRMARHYADDPRFSFGTWKIEILAGYSSAILLMVVALLMGIQSIQRLFHPVTIHFNEAIPIAIIGLIINLICGLMQETGKTLIDAEMGHPVVQEIKEVIAEFPQVEITDLHVWKVGRGKFSCILGLETAMSDLNPDQVKAALVIHQEIVHASVEIHHIE